MKKLIIVLLSVFIAGACNKDLSSIDRTQLMLANKTWFLTYSINENSSKSFIGKNTYFIQFSNTGTTIDSDGIIGNYSVQEHNNNLSIFIDAITQNGSLAKYTYLIEQISSDQLIVSYHIDGIKTKKIFSTTR
jgi:hypothetical protein